VRPQACRRPPGTGGTGSARRRRRQPRCRTPSGSSRGNWPPAERTAIRDALHSDRFADLAPDEIWATLLDEGTYLGSVSTYYRVLRQAGENRERRARATHPGRGQARAGRRRAGPGVLLGHHQAARPGEMDLLPPVRDLGHLLPVRRGLDGRDPRVRCPGREADRRDLRQAGHQPRAAEHPRRPGLLDDLQAGRAAAGRSRRHPVPLHPGPMCPTTTRTPKRSSRR
jgi:hypothetical protein